MSELNHQAAEARQARNASREKRKADLMPLLASFAMQAQDTYETLRPLAEHVGSVPREHPLRHQQVHGGLGGSVVADYLMISFGNHHDITLYKDSTRDFQTAPWRFIRSRIFTPDSMETEEIEIKQTPSTFSHITGGYELEVSAYIHAERVGFNPIHKYFLCSWFDEYANAEDYIQEFEEDLIFAVAENL